jgi:predicted transcriptional regulator YdeE
MDTKDIEGFEATGLLIRTTNENEMNPETAKIAELWARFGAGAFPLLTQDSRVFGLYTNYESDDAGAFDVIACSDTLTPESLTDSITAKVESGKYVRFSAQGEMPKVVIDLWGEVWNYFAAENCPHQRAYTVDFEQYKNPTDVEVYIAVK